MVIREREFYRSARGPTPNDEDAWRLVFDPGTGQLLVRHEWEAAGHNGVDEFELSEFLARQGPAQAALLHRSIRPGARQCLKVPEARSRVEVIVSCKNNNKNSGAPSGGE